MEIESTEDLTRRPGEAPGATETRLLQLFAPWQPRSAVAPGAHSPHAESLWRSDAVHRARNLAQLAVSLAHIGGHPDGAQLSAEATARARALALAYHELGREPDPTLLMPCVPLLAQIAGDLVFIFGRARQVAIIISAAPVSLPADRRRALVLMASEFIINALKHGFPAGRGGTISVDLVDEGGGAAALIVEDDGVGMIDSYRAGQGGGLLDQLAAVLGAAVKRAAGRDGHGFRIVVRLSGALAG